MDTLDIPAGCFLRGAAKGYWDERPAHEVKIRHTFRIGTWPVSYAEFEQFAPNHRRFRGRDKTPAGDSDPVRFVTWEEANAYCRWLSGCDGIPYRLPTEAEWEYAFRTNGAALTGGCNVENWCLDWYGPYPSSPQEDPVGYASGDCRVVRGGSWRAPDQESDDPPSLSARLGALPKDRNPAIGLRVVQALPVTTPSLPPTPAPRWAQDVGETVWDWKPAVEMSRPFFAEPIPYVQVPPGAQGPLFSKHNHVPALAACPNGDLLAVWYSTNEEMGRELTVAAARLRCSSDAWDEADLFWDVPGRNDHAPALWTDGRGVIHHFNGLAAEGGWQNLALIERASRDNGRTWSSARFLATEREWGNMPIASPFESKDGAIYLPCDADPGPRGGTVLHVSRDGGQTWSQINKGVSPPVFAAGRTGAWIAGIHAGVAEWTAGVLVAVGRGDEIKGRLAMSVSQDGGLSWTYAATPFPPISSGQRPVLRRLQEDALLLVSFTPGSSFMDRQGQEFAGHGMFAALSFDGGRTWPVRRLLTDGRTRTLEGRGWTHEFTMDAAHAEPMGYLTAIQTPDGMIHLISSGIHYRFNFAWLQGNP